MPTDTPLTLRDLNRATLARQGLLEPLRGPIPRAVEALGALGALQSQHPEWPIVALGSRLEGTSPTKLTRAFAERRIVRASLMRITLHVVSAAVRAPCPRRAAGSNVRRSRRSTCSIRRPRRARCT